MLILFFQRTLARYLRVTAMLLVLGIISNLFFLGAQPVAVNLIPTPWDKLVHGAIFALLACGIGLASGLHGWRMLTIAVAGALLVGVLDEWHQLYLPGRQPGWDDLLADAAGSVAGAALLAMWRNGHIGRS